MKPKVQPNPQTIASLYKHGHTLGGGCWNCTPPRRFKVPMPELITLRGPDYLVRHAIKRIVCKECRSPLDLQVVSADDQEPHDFSLAWTQVAHPPSEVGPKRL